MVCKPPHKLPNIFVLVSILPCLGHVAIISPVELLTILGYPAPPFDKVVVELHSPINGLEEAFTIPFSSHIAVAFPYGSQAMRGAIAGDVDKMVLVFQFMFSSFALETTEPFSIQAATRLPFASEAICGSEAFTLGVESNVDGKAQLISLLITCERGKMLINENNSFFII